MAREKVKRIRLSGDELQRWEEGARRLGTTVSALVRRAVRAALTQQPLLSLEELYQAREAFRRAGVNLNGVLYAMHRYDNGVLDELPPAEEFRFMLDDIRASAAHYRAALAKLP